MATTLFTGLSKWSLVRDEAGYREYRCTHKIKADTTDGPRNVLNTAGLPLPGSAWSFQDDADPFVWCRPNAEVKLIREDDAKGTIWTVEQLFSNKPLDDKKQRCFDQPEVDNPLLEPQRVSGSFVRYQEEAVEDRWGDAIVNSAHERIRGDAVTFDANRPQVRIVQNVPLLQLELFAPMVDTVNVQPFWGLPARSIKLSDVQWEKKYWGNCLAYYERAFIFDIRTKVNPVTGITFGDWDREVPDEAGKVLSGHWSTVEECETPGWIDEPICGVDPDPDNPSHFKRIVDRDGNPTRLMLDGNGRPAEVNILLHRPVEAAELTLGSGVYAYGRIGATGTAGESRISGIGKILVQKYRESNFLLLGIPLVF